MGHLNKTPKYSWSYTKTDLQRDREVFHVINCNEENCEYCQTLVDDGIIISCDDCGNPNHTDWLGWSGKVDSKGRCFVYCPQCYLEPWFYEI